MLCVNVQNARELSDTDDDDVDSCSPRCDTCAKIRVCGAKVCDTRLGYNVDLSPEKRYCDVHGRKCIECKICMGEDAEIPKYMIRCISCHKTARLCNKFDCNRRVNDKSGMFLCNYHIKCANEENEDFVSVDFYGDDITDYNKDPYAYVGMQKIR